MTDNTNNSPFAWKIAGGDVVLIRNGSYRMGADNGDPSQIRWLYCGNPPNTFTTNPCYMPPIPSGTAAQHTRILGENYASCKGAVKPELFGVQEASQVITLDNSSYVDLQCLDITDHANCTYFNGGGLSCKRSGIEAWPLDESARFGLSMSGTSNIALQDLDVHGLAADGLIGGHLTNVSLTRVRIAGNGVAGWDATSTGSINSGTFLMDTVTIEWNGCGEVYPRTVPDTYDHCGDDVSGGYGDGFGSNDSSGDWTVRNSIFRYNTQDGLDMLYVGTNGLPAAITAYNNTAYGNMGNQMKLGPSNAITYNNVVIGNCRAMIAALAQGVSGFNSHLTDFCRAGGDAINFSVSDSKPAQIYNNSITSHYNIGLAIYCDGTRCTNGTVHINVDNNLFFGFPDLSGGHAYITAIYQDRFNFFQSSQSTRRNNLLFHTNENAVGTCAPSYSISEKCVLDPLLMNSSAIDNIDFHLTALSPAKGAGIALSGLSFDHDGNPRPLSLLPAIGALE
jgi:hypothetical protein